MRIATWNVNGLRARLAFVLHWLRARQPDVVGIQEIKLTEEQFPTAEIEAAGYHAVAHGQKAWNGVAVLSREPAVVGIPLVSKLSFTTTGMPCSGPRGPLVTRSLSRVSASRSASSLRKAMLFNAGPRWSKRSIRAR